MSLYYVGIMSGTSIDGLDVVIASAQQRSWKTLAHYSYQFPRDLKNALFDLAREEVNDIDFMADADVYWAEFASTCVNRSLESSRILASDIIAIGSHGQTIRHRPEALRPFSLQIGCPSTIAYRTGIDVVADFRRKDIAAGGQGAPLVPRFHESLFKGEFDWALLNLGGIANISFCDRDNKVSGFDIGPANTLTDSVVRREFRQDFDVNGDIARNHSVNKPLLHRMISDQYFQCDAPKSTGPEYFNIHWVRNLIEQPISSGDLVATLTELTAMTCAQQINDRPWLTRVYLCGGGAFNRYLKERLQAHCSASVSLSTDLGIDPQAMEALAFAWLAKQRIELKTGNSTAATGAAAEQILGGIFSA